MSTNGDNPDLTAFALGELDDVERARLEAELTADPEAQAEAERIRDLAGLLEAEFAAEPMPALTADQRAAVLHAARPWYAGWKGLAAAAGIGLCAYTGLTLGATGHSKGSVFDDSSAHVADNGTVPIRPTGPVGLDLPRTREQALAPEELAQVHYEVQDSTAATTSGPSAGKERTFPPEYVARKHRNNPGTDQPEWSHEGQQAQGGQGAGNATPASGDEAKNKIWLRSAKRLEQDDWFFKDKDNSHELTLEELEELEETNGFVKLAEDDANTSKAKQQATATALLNRGLLRLRQGGDKGEAMGDLDRAIVLLGYTDAPGQQPDRTTVLRGLLEAEQNGQEALNGYYVQIFKGYRSPQRTHENPFSDTREAPRSTFSIDVDTASYANMRQRISRDYAWPSPERVRIEELINYFDYDYAQPTDEHPFATHVEVASCPWNASNRLVRIGLKGLDVKAAERPSSNLVFLLDVSGSMSSERKLPLLKQAMELLLTQLNGNDKVAIVVYAGASGLVLDSTSGDNKEAILDAIQRLSSGGSTNGGAGIELAYQVASRNYIEGGINRVILATDGDFNVGTTDHDDLIALIERKAKSKVFLSALRLGEGNASDPTMEQLADHGNGVYSYLDTLREAKKVLVDEISGTLFTIAKDVKLQLEFNPTQVASYRLIGYENRVLAARDFNDDTKDAGEIGAGHTVTAIYEVVPVNAAQAGVDPLRYQDPSAPAQGGAKAEELLYLKLRYKQPEGDVSRLLEVPVIDTGGSFDQASQDFRFASSVAAFGMILKNSAHKGEASLAMVEAIAKENPGLDRHGYRAEFVKLVGLAKKVAGH